MSSAAGDVDAEDPGVRVRAADERGGERVVAEVVEVGAVAAEQAVVLQASDRLAEHRGHWPASRRSSASRFSSAARRTALTMFW